MTGVLPIIRADRQLSERRVIKLVILGKSGLGKTSSLRDLINSLPLHAFPAVELDDGTPQEEVRS